MIIIIILSLGKWKSCLLHDPITDLNAQLCPFEYSDANQFNNTPCLNMLSAYSRHFKQFLEHALQFYVQAIVTFFIKTPYFLYPLSCL
jgi:hypothetical protein